MIYHIVNLLYNKLHSSTILRKCLYVISSGRDQTKYHCIGGEKEEIFTLINHSWVVYLAQKHTSTSSP